MLADAVATANPSRAAEAAAFIFSMLYIKFDKGPLSRRLGLVFLLALIRGFSRIDSMVWVALLFSLCSISPSCCVNFGCWCVRCGYDAQGLSHHQVSHSGEAVWGRAKSVS